MRSITRSFLETGEDYNLSPEHWLSAETAIGLSGSRMLGDVVVSISQQAVPPVDAKFVLDTNNAREGLLDLPILADPASFRVSTKKTALDGDVIISRLRPYLRQVAWLPVGACKLLGIEKFYCSTEFFVLRRKDGKNAAGIAAWLLSEPIQSMISEAATGGHHPRINIELILNSPIEERYLDLDFADSVGRVLTSHLQGQRELLVLLRH